MIKNLNALATTYHFSVERAARFEFIKASIGIGQPIKEVFNRGVIRLLTDTGVIFILSADSSTIITCYAATYGEILAMYQSVKAIPKFLRTKVDRNMSFGIVGKRV